MKQLMASLQKENAERRLPVLRMEIDYELATLFEALQNQNKKKIQDSKRKLELYRREWLMLVHETSKK
ncbi:hypothetical protein G4V62_05270 [Bacillaceae bacterium SIJ1]|uniref:hypothetical protein n=1 Tax=Litoribacterium kuwaitense TaxID=1398745 RepID=UPI0013EE08BC|nr:hypothetical protein [Litoribacterium kuwaitense]NGP44392.1 hypothetical protein [Litoribacterium kuwaitense]